MASQRHWLGVGVIGLCGWLMTGCASTPDFAIPDRSLAADISKSTAPALVRSQIGDGPLGAPQKITPPTNKFSVFPIEPLDKPAGFMPETRPTAPLNIAPPPGIKQTSLLASRGTVRVQVRAWVNGRPIFEDEVEQGIGPDLRRIYSLPPGQQAEELTKMRKEVLDQIIDQEVMYQDAVKKLEKINPPALVKMKDYVDNEFDKTLKKMRDAKVPEDQIREIEPTARRMMERNLISGEYARSRINDAKTHLVNMDSIREYYETHKNEFRTVDKVVWQDIFIPVDKNLPSVEHVRRFAEEAINKCRTPGDFEKLMVYNQGDSKLRGGEGLGQRLSYTDEMGKRILGEIRPLELDEHLAKLREGEIGPVVPFPMGVHLIRVVKREYAGQMPLDDKVQKAISRKLEEQVFTREYRRIVRELRLRAVIDKMERETP